MGCFPSRTTTDPEVEDVIQVMDVIQYADAPT
jgi:hypothetical protein